MNPITALISAAAVSAATTALTVGFIMLAFGHVHNDRQSCLALTGGAPCVLSWEPAR